MSFISEKNFHNFKTTVKNKYIYCINSRSNVCTDFPSFKQEKNNEIY